MDFLTVDIASVSSLEKESGSANVDEDEGAARRLRWEVRCGVVLWSSPGRVRRFFFAEALVARIVLLW